jgi:predicted AlkP superfamily pyrophosphatase or phosphodiesterase
MRLPFALLFLVAFATLAWAEPPSVIVISWDGVRHDQPASTPLPGLERMAREGARAERLIPVFPSLTFPSHVSLATGTYPDRHGIVSNVFRDRERGSFDYTNDASWLLAEPLWATAERQGVPAATFFWVGSETPWRGTGARYRKAPFDREVPETAKVEQILAWLDLPAAERPRLIMSWWRGSDRAGHRHGPDSEEVLQALRNQDERLVELLAGIDARGLWQDLTLLVVSDHGMSLATQGIDLEAALAEAGAQGEIVASTASAHVFLEAPEQASAVARALGAHPEVDAYPAEALPSALRLGPRQRLGDVVCITRPPNTFRAGALERAMRAFGLGVGSHGYAPEHPDVHGIFHALGRGVAPGSRLASARAVDVAPTVAAWLGISPPEHSEGNAIDLRAPQRPAR